MDAGKEQESSYDFGLDPKREAESRKKCQEIARQIVAISAAHGATYSEFLQSLKLSEYLASNISIIH